jgi:uncharacterized protein (DUF1778 family)
MLPVQDYPFGEQKEKKGKEKKMKKDKKKEKRETEIKIRLTAEEKEKLRELAKEEGLTISKYVRNQALKKQVKKQTGLEREMLYELHKIGVNLNQMARTLNILRAKEKIGDKVFLEVKTRIEKSLAQLEEILKKCL